jgi:hypothetical protein
MSMLHFWGLLALALAVALASLALLRGAAALLVARGALARLEALGLVLAGVVGWLGVVLAARAGG